MLTMVDFDEVGEVLYQYYDLNDVQLRDRLTGDSTTELQR